MSNTLHISLRLVLQLILCIGVCSGFNGAIADETSTDWPAFRGKGATGLASGFATATEWDVTDPSDKAIRWRTELPGLGHSCPVVVGDRIIVATAVPENGESELQIGRNGNIDAANDNGKQSWLLLCYDKNSGDEIWQQTVCEGVPKTTRHTKATHANTTVAVDGDNVVAFFGSEGLYCYSLEGELKWKMDLGIVNISKYGTGWGYASSPAVLDGHIVLVCDDPENPYVVALKLEDGEEIWRRSRKGDCERSWGTPLIHKSGDKSQVVVNGWPWIVSYELETGNEVWRIEGGGDNPIPSPFVSKENIFISSSHGGKSPVIAVRTDARGNITQADSPRDAGLVWRLDRGGAYMPTPLVIDDYVYVGDTRGVMRCFNAASGEKIYENRLPGGAYLVASLVAADDKIYCSAEDGTVFVIATGPQFKVLSINNLGEPCLATPAISEGIIYFRTTQSLVAIGPRAAPNSTDVVESPTKRPNVLFIAVDDLRPTLGCYGDQDVVSPNIDQLANRGTLFRQAYCQVAVCNPSRASLMTGLSPDTLGVWTLPIHFREAKPDAITLPQWFRKFGYTAVSHGKIFHNPTPDPQSWSEPIRRLPSLPYVYPDGTRELVQAKMQQLPRNDWRKNNLRGPGTAAPDLPDNQLLDGARTDMCIEDLRRLGKSNKPFFLAMGYIRPHLSFVAPKKYWDMYDSNAMKVPRDENPPSGSPKWAMHNNSELRHYVDLMNLPSPWDQQELDEATARRLVHGYHACVSYIDAQIGRLLNALEEENLTENTVVVLWSDHGWKLGEYRGWGKMTNYEIDTRVPLIIAGPGASAGSKTDSLVELLDLYPTLCELADIEQPEFLEGKSLTPILQSPTTNVRPAAVSQYYRKFEGEEYMGYSLRTNEYRYIEWRVFSTGEIVARELYDHQGESQSSLGLPEHENIADSVDPSLLSKLSSLLQKTHPPQELSMLPAVHTSPSGATRLPVDFTVKNASGGNITVYPITPSGRRSRGRVIEHDNSATIRARLGGTFVVESLDGKIHQIHSPSWPAKPVVIE